jgi:hypothetical protein
VSSSRRDAGASGRLEDTLWGRKEVFSMENRNNQNEREQNQQNNQKEQRQNQKENRK